jgi:hypothetical protein
MYVLRVNTYTVRGTEREGSEKNQQITSHCCFLICLTVESSNYMREVLLEQAV